MSKYEDTYSDSQIVCPYCNDSWLPEPEMYDEGGYVIKCFECKNNFRYHTTFDISHTGTPDCELNQLKHIWEPFELENGSYDFCSICGKCRPYEEAKESN